ncbi:hypothetical protein PRIPAC_70081 [Pristionchus pacificus]|uniref:Uncharacterized protein n=1 Tax=Pristionchus pacificus TaxID=54126 RepID=A0A2A6BEL1_PRIPA|nr:hypothetical protein PRIPAC_70081 [Pristionchus pacificus]|eukprot:PDM64303.1 hypothetical protein PRIPAC_52559 [Pristionchus pacificus]
MKLFLLVFPLLLRTAESACINCGGADKTSAKRFKMPNKSVFTRLAGIELMEIFEITSQNNHEVGAQQCDAHAECAVFECVTISIRCRFNLPNKLCVLASEYARLSEDLTKGPFETIVFVKVRGKFTKALPKEKEACIDKSEYEDYVKHEVDKWLNPSPKKSTSAHGSSSPTTVSEPAQSQFAIAPHRCLPYSLQRPSSHHPWPARLLRLPARHQEEPPLERVRPLLRAAAEVCFVSLRSWNRSCSETTTGIGSAATSTASESMSKASSSVSTPESSTTSTRAQTNPSTTTEPEKTTTSAAGTNLASDSTRTLIRFRHQANHHERSRNHVDVDHNHLHAWRSSDCSRDVLDFRLDRIALSDDSSVPTTPTTVSKRAEDGVKRSTNGISQSTSITDESTTIDDVSTTQQRGEVVENEEPSSTESSPGTEESSTTTDYAEKVSTTVEPKEDDDSKYSEEKGGQAEIPEKTKEFPGGRYRIKNTADGYNLRAKDKKDVEMSSEWDSRTNWDIVERIDWWAIRRVIIIQSAYHSGRFLRADVNNVVNLAPAAQTWEEWTVVDNGDRTWSFLSYDKTWLIMGKGRKVTHTRDSSKAARFLLEPVM